MTSLISMRDYNSSISNNFNSAPPNFLDPVYSEQKLKEYQNNLLIEALPPIWSAKMAGKMMTNLPEGPWGERKLPPELRVHCIKRMKKLIYPLPEAIEFESVFSQQIRQGYLAHDPLNPATWKHRFELAKNKKAETPTGQINSTASCLLLCGYSGMGKSTLKNSILRLYPQVIRHRKYKGNDLCLVQIVYLTISVPHDGLLSGLCLAFFKAVDNLVGTNFLNQHSGLKIDLMLKKMEEIACNFFIGAIVVDELQNLNLAKSGGAIKVLSYFRSLLENVGIPIVLIGTYAATSLFDAGMQDARRATDEGIIDIWRPEKTDAHWNNFLNVLEQYMWIGNENVILTPEIRSQIYDLTQGITDFAVRLLMLAQRTSIYEGKHEITKDVLKRTSDRHFRLLYPALAALRSGNPKKMLKFDDLLPPTLKQKLIDESEQTEAPSASSPVQENDRTIIQNQFSLGITESTKKAPDKQKVVEEIKPEIVKPVSHDTDFEEGDLRILKPGMSAYEAIKAQGLIADIGKGNIASITEAKFDRRF